MNVKLRDEVQDEISGFKGIAVACHIYLQGCTRITLQPKVGKDGKLPEHRTFDEPNLKVTKANKLPDKVSAVARLLGGPSKFEDEGR